MRFSPIYSLVISTFFTGLILGSLGFYSSPPSPGAAANQFLQAQQLRNSAPSAQGERRKRVSQQRRQDSLGTLDQERLQKLAPLLVLLPIFAKHSRG